MVALKNRNSGYMKSKLYTRTGDKGTTSLVGGTRIKKNSERLEAYGTLDELSSFIGCVLSHPDCPEGERIHLLGVQDMLFNLGGYLASEFSHGNTADAWGLKERHILQLEEWTDILDEETPKVNAFVLPGGCMLCAHTHVARAVCRRAERRILTLNETEYVDPAVICYVNRLSDYLFILARYFNYLHGIEEIVWHKDDRE